MLRLAEEQHALEAEFGELRRGTQQLKQQLQGALGGAALPNAAPDPPGWLGSAAPHAAEDELPKPMRLPSTGFLDHAALPAAEHAGFAEDGDQAALAGRRAEQVHAGYLQEDMQLWHEGSGLHGHREMQAVHDEVAGFSEDTRALLRQLDAIQI